MCLSISDLIQHVKSVSESRKNYFYPNSRSIDVLGNYDANMCPPIAMAVLDVFPAVLIIKLIPTHRHPHRYGSDSIIEVILDYFGAFKASF